MTYQYLSENISIRTKLDKACFAHNAEYADSKNLAKGTVSYKILIDRYGTRNCTKTRTDIIED